MLSHTQTPTSTSILTFYPYVFSLERRQIFMPGIGRDSAPTNGDDKRYPIFPDENPTGGGALWQIIGESILAFAGRHLQSAWERYPWFPGDDLQPVGEHYSWFPDEDGDKGGKRATLQVWMLDGAGGVQ